MENRRRKSCGGLTIVCKKKGLTFHPFELIPADQKKAALYTEGRFCDVKDTMAYFAGNIDMYFACLFSCETDNPVSGDVPALHHTPSSIFLSIPNVFIPLPESPLLVKESGSNG